MGQRRHTPAFDVNVPVEDWEPCGAEDEAPFTRLLAHVRVCGLDCHLEAYQVFMDSDGVQRAVDENFTDAVDEFGVAASADGPWQTTTIMGRTYVLVMTPHC